MRAPCIYFERDFLCRYKVKNHIHAAYFAQRLLDLGEGGASAIRVKAQKVLKRSERSGRNEVRFWLVDGAMITALVGVPPRAYLPVPAQHQRAYDASPVRRVPLFVQVAINFDHKNPFSIGCRDFAPIYKGSPLIRCPYCFAAYKPEYKDSTCDICQIATVGTETLGLVSYQGRRR